jgi:hypothetical protein
MSLFGNRQLTDPADASASRSVRRNDDEPRMALLLRS